MSRHHSPRRTAAVLGLALAATLVHGAPATAETRTVSDAQGDQPPGGLDVVRVRYVNDGPVFGARVHLADLGDRGTVYVSAMGDAGADPAEVDLKVRRRADGTMRRKAIYGSREAEGRPIPCRVFTRWSQERDLVALWVKPRCLENARVTRFYDLSEVNVQVTTYRARYDRAPARWVERN